MRNPILERFMAILLPGEGYVLIVGRGDGKTLIIGTDNAGPRLALINGASPLEHNVRAVRTHHYKLITAQLRERFRLFADDAFGHWVHADFSDVVEAAEDFDPISGERIRNGALYVGDTGYVSKVGKGIVKGFRGDRVLMRFTDEITSLIPRSCVKSVVRVGQGA
jgi:hypothetical protein